MAVDSATFKPLTAEVDGLEALDPSHTDELLDLYETYSESFFLPAQLLHGVFYGVREDGRLVAAAGTHTVGRRAGIAAVGNVFTRPEARGRGYAAAATSAVVRDLLSTGCRDVVLNVAVTNTTAIGVYERLGFRRHSRYLEASAFRTR
jgi:predicted GNAT family acetyltransferase